MQRIARMDKLFDQLFAHIELLGKNRNPVDPCDWRCLNGPVELALYHLSTCRNMLKQAPAQRRRKTKRVANAA
jgi:hypothetical protein